MKNHHVFIILCIVCLIAAFSAGCTSPSTPATPAKTTTAVSTAAATPVSTAAATPVPTAVVTKPATPVPQVASANGSYTLNESDNKFYYSVPKNSQVYVVLDENPHDRVVLEPDHYARPHHCQRRVLPPVNKPGIRMQAVCMNGNSRLSPVETRRSRVC